MQQIPKSLPVLIASVATAVMIDAVRTVIQPGQPLPPSLAAHDARQLLASGAAYDPQVGQALTQAQEDSAQDAAQLYQQEREQVQQQRQSIQQPHTPTKPKAKPKGD